MSQREWKSLASHPCSDPLNSRAVTSLLFPSSWNKNYFCFSSLTHPEFNNNWSIREATIWGEDGNKDEGCVGGGCGDSSGFYN
jgi:hypothetical protein